MKTVVVGMSGGVDSSLSAFLLKERGYRVIGLFMKNWEEVDEKGVCRATSDYEDVSRVCEHLDIPYFSIQFVEEYQGRVFQTFLEELKAGRTPNPDILCNREIKFDLLLEKAKQLGGSFLATGHYCRLHQGHLLKGKDPNKDQSYFLHAVSGQKFENVLFPVGHLLKGQVRELAKKANLPTAEKKDSTGICFIGKRDFKEFLKPYLGYKQGEFHTLSGKVVGHHDGAAYYTIGQRKGLGLGGEGDAWYVIDKDITQNIVFVERGANHPALFHQSLIAIHPTWVHSTPAFPLSCTAKIRYRQTDQPCTVTLQEEGSLQILFDEPQRAITPGQAIVFYSGEKCLGGATIDHIPK
ncbi:MAG TPA: tRNA 2-thiouridine(34) synthase MnmA [Chlamydiales bacterium]|nr:tRNA 2-thiouridine(34) synthase MnmA [Chlamydiales bacterium]